MNIADKNRLVTAVISTNIPEFVEEIKNPQQTSRLSYKPFGSDNLYPQALASLYRKSVVLRGIINSKVNYIVGGGFKTDDQKLSDLILNINSEGESLNNIFERYLIDRFVTGNSFILVSTDSKESFINIDHIQSVKCRLNKKADEVIIHPDWSNYRRYKDKAIIMPLFPKFKRDGKYLRSIIHIKDYEPDFDYYGVPSYISAMDSAAIGYKTNKWNVSRLDNAFQSSGVLVVDGNMSIDDANKLKKEFKEEMTGEGNQGKILMIIKKLGGEGSVFTPINNNNEGDWIKLHSQSTDDIIIANNWKKSLAGISESQGFDVNRILNDYQMMKNSVIIREQNNFKNVLSRFLTKYDLTKLTIENKPPVSLLTNINANKIVKVWEARKEAGLDFDSKDNTQNVYIE